MHSLNVGTLLVALLCLTVSASSSPRILAPYEAVRVPSHRKPAKWTIPRRRIERDHERVQKRACEPLDTDCGNGFCCQALYTCNLPKHGSGGDTQCQIGGPLGGLLPGSEEPAYAESPPSPSPPSPPSSKHTSISSSMSSSYASSSTSSTASSSSASSTTSTTSATSRTSRIPTATSSTSPAATASGLSGGAIAGIVIGVFAAVALLAALASALYTWYRNRSEHETLGSIAGDYSASEMRDLSDTYGSSGPGASGGAAGAATGAATGAAMAAASRSALQAKTGASGREKALPPLASGLAGPGTRSQAALPQYQQQQVPKALATMPNFGPVMEMDGGGLGNQAPRAEMMGDMPASPASGAGTQRQLLRRPVAGPGGSRSVPRKSVYEMPG
jgi:hypothetical protein